MVLLSVVLFGCSGSGLENELRTADGRLRVACEDAIATGEEGEFVFDEADATGTREACSTAEHALGGAFGSTGTLTLDTWGEGTVRLEQRDWNGTVLATYTGLTEGSSIPLTVPYSGEHLLVLSPEEPDAGGDYAFSYTCETACDATWSRYPFFLMHGMGTLGDDGDSGLNLMAVTLRDLGYRVFEPHVDPFAGSAQRTADWREWLDLWRTEGTWRGVHVVAHSMGGVDARRLTSLHDPKHQVRTVTTLGTPHWGSPIADDTLSVMRDYSWAGSVLEYAADALARFLTDAENDQDLEQQLIDLSEVGMAEFNTVALDREDVWYRSWGGVTCGWFSFSCRDDFGDETVSWQLAPFRLLLDGPNDGMVELESTIWGDFQGVLAADHFDMNGIVDHDSGFAPVPFFENEAARLVAWEREEVGPDEPQAYSLDFTEDALD